MVSGMETRDSFRSQWGFRLACIGSAVGMGNIWLFPSRMAQFGGATFLIPYVIFVVLIASTGVVGEMAFGRPPAAGPSWPSVPPPGAAPAPPAGARRWASSLWWGLMPWPSAIPWWWAGF